MIITHKKNTANPNTYRVYSAQMKFSEQCMKSCERIMDVYYSKVQKEDGIIEMQLGTDIDIHEGVDALAYCIYSGKEDRWQIRNRTDIRYADEIAIKMRKLNDEPDEIYYTTATHYLTAFWNGNTLYSFTIVDMQALRQHVLANDTYYNKRCIKYNSHFYPMPQSEWDQFKILQLKRKGK